MAIITYTQDAVLGAYQQWLMQQGAQACLERRIIGQEPPNCANVAGAIVAQAGSQIRYSVLTTLSSATVFFMGQFQTEAGAWQNVAETVVGTSAGGIDQVTRPAVAGCYRTMVASVGTALVAGSEVYVLAELGRTNNGEFQPYAILVSGYVRTNEPIDSSPQPGVKNPPAGTSGGGGCCMTTLFDDTFDPDAGAYTVVVPSGANGRLVFLNATYVASGVAANRTINVQLNPASGFGWTDTNQNVQTAGQGKGYIWQIEGQTFTDSATGDFYRSLPTSLWFSGDFTVELRANNPQAGDNFLTSDITYEIKGP
jgi:hypothetical protein